MNHDMYYTSRNISLLVDHSNKFIKCKIASSISAFSFIFLHFFVVKKETTSQGIDGLNFRQEIIREIYYEYA